MREYLDHANRLCRLAVIPHAENDYRPYLLHPKRTVRYAVAFSAMKIVVLGLVVLLPASIFAAPEAVQVQEQELIRLVNDVRVANGASVLATDARLTQSARAKSADMLTRQYFAHTNADDEGPDTFATRAGYPYSVIGENLAMGFVAARDVLDAWERSPTHAQNMRDTLYEDTGLSVIGGTFYGEPTVFIAQHFGRERRGATTAPLPPTTPVLASEQPPTEASGPTNVAVAQPEIEQPLVRNATLQWERTGSDETEVTATVEVAGSVAGARVNVHGHDILLSRGDASSDTYTGTLAILAPPEDVFRVVVPGTLSLVNADGTAVMQSLPWAAPLVVRPSFGTKYAQAKTLLPQTFGPTLHVSRFVFALAFIIFAIAWLINLVVEIRRQHLDLLIPSGALVLLLGLFWWV
ncbi:MAG: CAP domain-containing protein [bacterium]|nr:CAP domain-containing protein [bacterium]